MDDTWLDCRVVESTFWDKLGEDLEVVICKIDVAC